MAATPLYAADLLDRVRRLTDDRVMPYEIDDALMYSFISDAERELAVVGKLMRQVVTYPIVEDDRWIEFEEGMEAIELRMAELVNADNRRFPLRIIGTVDSLVPHSDDSWSVQESPVTPKGQPTALIMGKRYNHFELMPRADAAYSLEVSMILWPTNPIEEPDDVLSIPPRYHSLVPPGAAVRAFDYSGYQEANANKAKSIQEAWKRTLVRVASEVNGISRDHGTVKFNNDLWT